jgi:uncharacterized protein YggE
MPQPIMFRRSAADARAAAPAPPVLGGELETNMTVTVQFDLAP